MSVRKNETSIQSLLDMLQKQKTLLGHLLRASSDDPLHHVTFKGDSKKTNIVQKRKAGRPSEQWSSETCTEAFYKIIEHEFLQLDKIILKSV